MCRDFFTSKTFSPKRSNISFDYQQRQIRKMLVIDRIELAVTDELHDMRKFERYDAIRLKEIPRPSTNESRSGT